MNVSQVFSLGFMPHGHCYLWNPVLVGLIGGSDAIIGISYFLISAGLVFLTYRIKLPFNVVFIAFGLFIGACGAGHFIDVMTIWHPYYWVTVAIRVVTATASFATVVILYFLIRKINFVASDVQDAQIRRLLVAAVKDYAIYTLDPSGKVMSWNEGAERLTGYSEEEIIGKDYSIFHHVEDVINNVPKKILSSVVQNQHLNGEGWRVKKDGTRIYVNFSLTVLRSPAGKHLGFAKVTQDVTQKKEIEEKLKRSFDELEERVAERTRELQESNLRGKIAQRRFEDLVNTVDGIVWESSVDGKLNFVSHYAEKFLGYPQSNWFSEVDFWRKVVYAGDQEKLLEATEEAIRNGEAKVEFRIVKSDGKMGWVRNHIRSFSDNDEMGKLRGVIIDISDLKAAEEERSKTERLKSVFIANMSHEIRTPLNAIIGMTTVGLNTKLSAEQLDCMTTIKTSADYLLMLVHDILDFSKLEAGREVLESGDFRLSTVCQNAIDVVSAVSKAREINPVLEVDPAVPDAVHGDSGRISQILLNLMSNAVKFTPERGEVKLVLKLVSTDPKARVRFEIHDSGIGISEDSKAKLFQPFSQADPSTSRRFGGTGLGLSICKGIVTLMGGAIGVRSEVGKGSVFWFEIPLQYASPAFLKEKQMGVERKVLSDLRGDLKILVAEDNSANQKVIRRFLSFLNCTADVVSSGVDAVALFRKGIYDLIFMDCQMPEMDGYEATRKIRELEKVSKLIETPIIALTAHAFAEDKLKCKEVGMNDYISKPIGLDKLKQVIFDWTDEKPRVPSGEVSNDPQSESSMGPNDFLDFQYLKELEELNAPGKSDLVLEVIRCFFAEFPTKIQVIKRAFDENDLLVLRREVHSFKATCQSVGAKNLAGLCKELETLAMENKKDELDGNDLIGKLEKGCELASVSLKSLFTARGGRL